MARGAYRLGRGESREASSLLRDAALWHAGSVLAADGEGYPGRKWVPEKAARKYGRDSVRYRELLEFFIDRPITPAGLLERVRASTVLPPHLAAALDGRAARLAPEVRHVTGSGRDVLIRGRAGLAEVEGTAAELCRALAGHGDWDSAVAELAKRYRLTEAEASAATWHETTRLRSAGFLQSVERPSGQGR